jgi:glycosyltransferase involved in cell wall biosynthesis
VGRSDFVILIPALNEAATIERVIRGACVHGDVIVVDDGSTDETSMRAREAGAHVVANRGKHGYDHAINAGFIEAHRLGYSFVVTMDADGEHNPCYLQAFRRMLLEDGVKLVIGRRPRPQRLAEALLAAYFRKRFGINDPLCGMKGYRMELFVENGAFDHVNSIGTELIFNAVRRGHSYREIEVSGDTRRDTPRFGRTFKANCRIGLALLRLMFLERKKKGKN